MEREQPDNGPWASFLPLLVKQAGVRCGRLRIGDEVVVSGGAAEADDVALAMPVVCGRRVVGELTVWQAGAFDERSAGCLQAGALAIGAMVHKERLERDLKVFVHGAAHDVRGAVARASSFAQLLVQRAGSGEAEVAELGGQLQSQLREAGGLIRDLAAYALAESAGRQGESRIADVFETAGHQLRGRIAARRAVVSFHPVAARVAAPERGLVDVIERLVDNALRFAGQRPVIRIAAAVGNGTAVITVEDNGPLFDAAYAERIFLPFERLHGKRHAGSGLGLAICRRQVECWGGSITAGPADPSGLRVRIELPVSGGSGYGLLD